MRITRRCVGAGASALIVLALSSLGSFGCAREGAAPDSRAPRQPPLESPLRSMLGPRAVLAAPTPHEWSTVQRAPPMPEVHAARHARR